MKSARGRGRDRTGLASGPATSPSCWQRRGYTTGRAEPRGRQLSGRASPRVRGPAPGARRGPAKLTALCAPARGGRSPASFPRSTSPGHPPSPYPASERAAAGPAPLPPRPPSSAPGGRRSAGPQTRALLDRVPFAVSAARGPLSWPRTVPSAGAGGRAGLPARVGGVWAPGESARRGRRGVCLRPARSAARLRPPGRSPRAPGVFRGAGLRRGRVRSASAPSPLPESATRTRGAPGQGWLPGSDWPASAPSLFRQLSRQSEVADTQETLPTAQSLLLTSLEPTRPRQTSLGPSTTTPGARRFQAARSPPLGTPWRCTAPRCTETGFLAHAGTCYSKTARALRGGRAGGRWESPFVPF